MGGVHFRLLHSADLGIFDEHVVELVPLPRPGMEPRAVVVPPRAEESRRRCEVFDLQEFAELLPRRVHVPLAPRPKGARCVRGKVARVHPHPCGRVGVEERHAGVPVTSATRLHCHVVVVESLPLRRALAAARCVTAAYLPTLSVVPPSTASVTVSIRPLPLWMYLLPPASHAARPSGLRTIDTPLRPRVHVIVVSPWCRTK